VACKAKRGLHLIDDGRKATIDTDAIEGVQRIGHRADGGDVEPKIAKSLLEGLQVVDLLAVL